MNYLRGKNPFTLIGPPAWWLREMQRFDPKLVLFPSSKAPVYILARRATRSAGESPHDVKGLPQHPDTLYMAEHRLVKVCEILPGTLWDMRIFQKLAAHDIHRLGGASRVNQLLVDRDARQRETLTRDQDAELDARSHDAWASYQARTGARLSLAKSQSRGRLTPNPVSVSVPHPQPHSPSPLWLPSPG